MIGANHLTTVNPEADGKAAHTHPGQAHFAEPTSRRSCAQCGWFETLVKDDQKGRCRKAASLMMKPIFNMSAFPASASACKFFELNDGSKAP